jgi:hypothetical protein
LKLPIFKFQDRSKGQQEAGVPKKKSPETKNPQAGKHLVGNKMATTSADSVFSQTPPIGYDKSELLHGNFVPTNSEPVSPPQPTLPTNKKPVGLPQPAALANKKSSDLLQPALEDPFRYKSFAVILSR